MGKKRTKSTPRKKPDRISCLPGHVTDQILSYLPIREAVRTSVLSSDWRKKWYTIPNLVFDRQCVSAEDSEDDSEDPSVIQSKILKIVDYVLLVHSGPINLFKFAHYDLIGEGSLVTDIDRWIFHLIGRSIKELVLKVWIDGEYYEIPRCLFSCQSLHFLKLLRCSFKPPTMFEGFRNLKSLDLQIVEVAQDAFETLISRCPMLEKLRMREVFELTQINIHAPNLKFFEIRGEFEGISFDNTFQLTTIVVDSWLVLNSESNQSRLPGCSSNLLKFLDHWPHVQSLEICSNFLKYLAAGVLPVQLPTNSIDLSFLSLRNINFDNLEEISAALCLMKSSPNLRKLEIYAERIDVCTSPLTPATYCWEDIFSWPAMLFRVQHVTIDGISGTKSELNFIRFLLLYSPVLEKMIVKPVGNVILKLMRALNRFKRASGEVKVIWEEPFYNVN